MNERGAQFQTFRTPLDWESELWTGRTILETKMSTLGERSLCSSQQSRAPSCVQIHHQARGGVFNKRFGELSKRSSMDEITVVVTERSRSDEAGSTRHSHYQHQLQQAQKSKRVSMIVPASVIVPAAAEAAGERAPAVLDSTKNFGTLPGDGDESYAKNSSAQMHAVQTVLPLLNEAVDRLALPTNSSCRRGPLLVIADLGCSSGPNCLKSVDNIVGRLKARYVARGLLVPSFQVFFQDLPSNDFNNLFRLLSERNGFHADDDRGGEKSFPSKYFAAGVPGTFYGRLFPDSSVHVVFASYSLHWMSKVPEPILVKGTPAFNKGRSWVHGAAPEVAAAYRDQAARDLRQFLVARAEEVVSGGVMFLLLVGRRNPDPAKVLQGDEGFPAILWELVDLVFARLAAEGFISEDLRDSYNCATYFRHIEEVREGIESCSSEWRILKLEPLPIYHFQEYLARFCTKPAETPHSFSRRILLMYKATRAPQIMAHIGPELSKVFWEKYEEMFFGQTGLVEEFYSRIERPGGPATQIVVSLIRK